MIISLLRQNKFARHYSCYHNVIITLCVVGSCKNPTEDVTTWYPHLSIVQRILLALLCTYIPYFNTIFWVQYFVYYCNTFMWKISSAWTRKIVFWLCSVRATLRHPCLWSLQISVGSDMHISYSMQIVHPWEQWPLMLEWSWRTKSVPCAQYSSK